MKRLAMFFVSAISTAAICYGGNSKSLQQLDGYNYVIGTQSVGAKYKFTAQTNLVETAQAIRDMGSNILKISMSPRYWWENYDIPKDESVKSLTDLAHNESFEQVLGMDFKYYQIWAYEFSQYTQEAPGQKRDQNQIRFIGGLSDADSIAVYNEIYNLACHILKKYSHTGKVFMLGNWEADWHMYWDYDVSKPVDPATVEGMIKWFTSRQKAIDDAKRDTPHKGIELYHYVEVNNSTFALSGKVCVTNSVLPHINPDYVSFSSYTTTNPPKTYRQLDSTLTAHLNYIESKIEPKNNIIGKRLFIGEYGWPESIYDRETINQRAKWVIRSAMKWGSPFILFWEMYNNELRADGSQNGYWLIDEHGVRTPLYYTHSEFYAQAREKVADFLKIHGRVPSREEFSNLALSCEALSE